MAYNDAYPQYYPQNYQPQYQQSYPQNYQTYPQQTQQQQQIQQPQIQNGGFMLVPTEEMARTYPVAPGNCVTFKIEGKPIVMEKSMGFSQLEAPRVDRYRLVKEDEVITPEPIVEQPQKEEPEEKIDYTKQFEDIKNQFHKELDEVWGEIDALKEQLSKPTTTKKKDNGGN